MLRIRNLGPVKEDYVSRLKVWIPGKQPEVVNYCVLEDGRYSMTISLYLRILCYDKNTQKTTTTKISLVYHVK